MNPTGLSSTIYCINLKSRPDRWENTQSELGKLGWKPERFEAFPGGAKGCRDSHAEIIKRSIHKPHVFVLEDDIKVLETNVNLYHHAFDSLPVEWDILYFGGKLKHPLKKHKNLYIAENVVCTHAIVYSHRVYGRIISSTVPIDQYIRHTIQQKGNCYFVNYIGQREDYSDIKNRYVKALT